MVVAGLAIAAWGAGCGSEDTPTGAQGTVASSTSSAGGMGGAGGAACVPNDPPIEVCDYIDNDCNGVVDEGFDFGCGHIKSDTDGDGIRDELEVYGTEGLDLPAMGANPLRIDVFVHSDWMADGTHDDRFADEAYWRVQQAYLAAPVDNLDGSTGISLHIDSGPDSIMDPLTMNTWGELSEAGAIPHLDELPADPTGGGAPLDELRDQHLPEARRRIFHYNAAVHALEPEPRLPPCSELMSQFNGYAWYENFVVSQGSTDPLLVALGGFDPNVQDVVQQAAHYMHELGHTLGLRHGGVDDINRKPNYFSVMNYHYSYRGLYHQGSYGRLDYSRFSLPSLDETALDEQAGLGAPEQLADYGFIRFCGDVDVTCAADAGNFGGTLVEEPDATAAIDWNCNNTIDTSPVEAEINVTFPKSSHGTHNDWDNMDFRVGVIGANAAPQSEPPRDDPYPIPYRVVAAGEGHLRVQPGEIRLRFALINRGTEPDTYLLDIDGVDLELPVHRVSLAPGSYEVVEATLRVPPTAEGERLRARLHVQSEANPYMAAEASTQLDVHP